MPTLKSLIKRYKVDLESMQRIACATVSGKVVSRTPVDKGDARASWTPNNGEPVAENINVSEGETRRHDLSAVVNTLKPGDTFSLSNGQGHIRPLEYEGHSPQAPAGMMRRSLAEWQQIVDEAVRGA